MSERVADIREAELSAHFEDALRNAVKILQRLGNEVEEHNKRWNSSFDPPTKRSPQQFTFKGFFRLLFNT